MKHKVEAEEMVLVVANRPVRGMDRVIASMSVPPKQVPDARTVLGLFSTDLHEVPISAPREEP